MKLLLSDSQRLEIQTLSLEEDGKMIIRVINTDYQKLKGLFTDPVAMKKITLQKEDGIEEYENYTIFISLKEENGGIFSVELEQEGKDTVTRIKELEAMKPVIDAATEQITQAQEAICELYETIVGGVV